MAKSPGKTRTEKCRTEKYGSLIPQLLYYGRNDDQSRIGDSRADGNWRRTISRIVSPNSRNFTSRLSIFAVICLMWGLGPAVAISHQKSGALREADLERYASAGIIQDAQGRRIAEYRQLPSLEPTSGQIQSPRVEIFRIETVFRRSDRQDEHGRGLPPWNGIEPLAFSADREPQIGQYVTVVPLEVNIPAFNMRIVSAEKKRDECDDNNLKTYWESKTEGLNFREFFEAKPIAERAEEYPFDVVIIYPSVKYARAMGGKQIDKATLPKAVSPRTVKAAIDLTNDSIPDLLIVEYCCMNRARSTNCDLTCSESYRRSARGWRLVSSNRPC